MALQDGPMERMWERSSQSAEGANVGLPSHGAGRLQEGRPGTSKASTQTSNTARHFGETQKAVEFVLTQNAGVGEAVTPPASQERHFSANPLSIPTHLVSSS